MNKMIDSVKSKRRFILCLGVMLIALSAWVIPLLTTEIKLSALNIEDVTKIIYVQYEDQPLSSKVKSKKYYNMPNDSVQIKEFVRMFKEGDIKLMSKNKSTSDMLFLYLKNDNVVNAYVADDSLGFQYGKYWVEFKEINDFITSMQPLEDVEVKDLSTK